MKKSNKTYRISVLVITALLISISLNAATPITDPNAQPPAYLAGMALSTDFLVVDPGLNPTGGGKAYRPWFENGAWQGDLVEHDVSASGVLTTTVDMSSTPPGGADTAAGDNWSARTQLDAMNWDTGRKIITVNSDTTTQVAFRWPNLATAQKTAIDTPNELNPTSPVLDFLRGDRTNEEPAGLKYRTRFSTMGDIMHMTPIYVGKPKELYNFGGYDTFRDGLVGRAPRVYAGANDGMLHVFDAVTGNEVYAYIPSTVVPNLHKLSDLYYNHQYFVDGQITVADAQIGGVWKTILVGGLGAGGQGFFALDITDPDLTDETSVAGTDAKILWEIDSSIELDIGYAYSKPTITRLNDGKWYAVVGNGYSSSTSEAKLLIIDLETGALTRSLATDMSGNSLDPNGLSTPALMDIEGDFKADYAYAGDVDGNMWKFDLTSTTPATWSVMYAGAPFFKAGKTQPITTAPDLAAHPNGGFFVFFGTGKAFNTPDLSDTAIQSIYGLRDDFVTNQASPNLVTQVMTNMTHTNVFDANDQVDNVRVISNNPVDYNPTAPTLPHTGWKIDLPPGERVLVDPIIRAERLQVATTNPSIDGTPENAEAWFLEPFFLNGGTPLSPVFDLYKDTILNDTDNVDANSDGDITDPGDIAMGWQVGNGIVSQPVFGIIGLTVSGTIDTLFINNLILPFVETCTGTCAGGFAGGHMDVDTDAPNGDRATTWSRDVEDGLGGMTDGHVHEYDKDHGVVFTDWFNLEPRRGLKSMDVAKGVSTLGKKLNRIEEVDKSGTDAPSIVPSQQFIVVLTNADLNWGGEITIGTKTWPVVDYQDMMVDILQNGKPLVDPVDGASLVFTLSGIQAGGGTLRIDFDNKAIIDGALLPTVWDCPKGHKDTYNFTTNGGHPEVPAAENKHITKIPSNPTQNGDSELNPYPVATTGYRWRNGALTMQILDATNYTLQDWSFLPQDSSGNVLGGVHAKMYSAPPTSAIGAVVAKGPNESGLLYEGLVYWHYGDLYEDIRTGKRAPCYGVAQGASTWAATVNIERKGLTTGEYLALLGGLDENSPEIIRYFDALAAVEACLASGCSEATLLPLLTELSDATTPISDYVKYRGYARDLIPDSKKLPWDITSNTTTGPIGAKQGVPATVTGTPESPGDTVGPNYVPGRRTWTDLTPSY